LNVVGVDGCSSGWFTIQLLNNGGFRTNLCSDISTLWNTYQDAQLILIDIPIGLKEAGSEERLCDKEARKILGQPRGTSVFRSPCWQSTKETDYQKCSQINERITGKKLSQQSFRIIPKIREVNTFLTENLLARSKIMEIHPELCFHMFSGRSMKFSKKKSSGYKERIEVLRQIYPDTDLIVNQALFKYKGKSVVADDILDALAAALTAKFGYEYSLKSIPSNPEIDSRGLSMRIMYWIKGV
jgi:predicted RNase H-like nuclease